MRQKKADLRILVIEPYYGGSHKSFLTGLLEHLRCEYSLLSLPARKWKMRMQLSAPWFAEQVEEMKCKDRWYDCVLCSTFVDVAVLRALLVRIEGWNPAARFCTYFHENQFAYPGRFTDASINQFRGINFSTGLASDSLAFNSGYNLDSFLQESGKVVRSAADMGMQRSYDRIAKKSRVLAPGMDFRHIDGCSEQERNSEAVLVWNHRWEHDKNPEEFFEALITLKAKGIRFRLVVLGESFQHQPGCFAWAREKLSDELLHFGYARSVEEYACWLKRGDIVVSTALHEFFGISVLEAVRAGCRPVLPDRLSYPELFPEEFLYQRGDLVSMLEQAIVSKERLSEEQADALTSQYSWQRCIEKYQEWLSCRELYLE